nr:helicase-primase helicase subunit [Monodontid alphaherpesvirus 2]
MHGVQPIVSQIRRLSAARVPAARRPSLRWFRGAVEASTPLDIPCVELPFAAYLITGNAGSGKSTCVQTLNEAMECVITGATRVAAQNIYVKLSASYASRHINTIFHEFGFRANHVQAVLGREQYVCAASPPSVAELQLRDIVYYWDVLLDISRRVLQTAPVQHLADLQELERRLGLPPGRLASLGFCTHASLPAFVRSNVIVIDEAGLLGRHVLTAVVYAWWLLNCAYQSPQYAAGARPVVVCIGSPTQTDSLESTFEHRQLRCRVRASENILTYLITNRTLRQYADVPRNWTIFINNKRCQEYEFGELLKALEYGLPLTEEHRRLVDEFVVPESFINSPANLQGWTRLYSSHKEVSAYMSKLHAHLKVTEAGREFVVFTLPVYTMVGIRTFEEYCELTDRRGLSLTTWLTANAGRITNYSQSRDQDTGVLRCEVFSKQDTVLAQADVTHVLNSQVAVTTRLKKLVFGFSGTFAAFARVLNDDTFVKTQGEAAVEYAYRFLSTLMFGGMIEFYNFLRAPGLPPGAVSEAYPRLAEVTRACLAESGLGGPDSGPPDPPVPPADPDETARDDDLVFAALHEGAVDLLYCDYDLARPESTPEVHAQFLMLKDLFARRYDVCRRLFGERFTSSGFSAYVDSVTFKGCEVFVGGLRGGLLAMAMQTDSYTLMGYTHAPVLPFAEDIGRRQLADGVRELLGLLKVPRIVLRDQHGFVSVVNTNISEFVECVEDRDLNMAVNLDYGISSKLAMTIARSQGLSLEKVAICFPSTNLRLNSVYVAMSRTVSSRFLRMNLNPLREKHERDNVIGGHILAALRDPNVHIVY